MTTQPTPGRTLRLTIERFPYHNPFRISGHVFAETAVLLAELSDGTHVGRGEGAGVYYAAFTNLRTGEPCPNENALLATILADATNLGLSRMAAASQGVTRDQLLWTHDAYIRDDSYRAALAILINAHHRLPFSRVWGDGTTSSSDGQFFRGAKRGASGGDINARYGVDHGFSFYTHVSDQRSPYHVNWHSSNRSAASSGAAVSPGGMKAITLPKRRRVPDWILPN